MLPLIGPALSFLSCSTWKWIAGGTVAIVALGSLYFLHENYMDAQAQVIELQHNNAMLEKTLNETRIAAFVREEQLRADLDTARAVLTRRSEDNAKLQQALAAVQTIERPDNEKHCPDVGPATVYAVDWLRRKNAGTPNHNGTQAGNAAPAN